MQVLPSWLSDIKPLHGPSMQDARQRLDSLTKPRGSLGRLEELAIKIAGITADPLPRPGRKVIVVMAGDHGVVEEGVSAFPSSVTPQMVRNFVSGGAAINVLARHAGAEVTVVDVGVAVEVPGDGYLRRNVRRGTANMCRGPAMTLEEARRAVMVGAEVAREEVAKGARLIGTGDMGIGNTTPSTAIVCAVTGYPASKIAGRGTGIDDAGLVRKIAAVERALDLNRPSPTDGLDILHKVGGLEIGALAGLALGAASCGVPVVIDGFISTAAACIAALLSPAAKDYMIASHLSAEPGHRIALETLGCAPLVALNMRLGEGTGAALAMFLCDASLRILAEMATFEEAGVSR
jgi:nicotinate-nucleotide--dimethylbenzimidazole phosphoribosyltransferase